MRRILFAIAAVAFGGYISWPAAAAFDDCLGLFPGGSVPDARSDTVTDLCKSVGDKPIFAVRFDTTRKIPNWTAHSLSLAQKGSLENSPAYKTREDFFTPDPNVDTADQAKEQNYKNTHFNKGHLVSASDMNWNDEAYRTTFVMTNMTPQRKQLNSGPWRGMERAFQKLVKSKKTTLWAIAGVYGVHSKMPTLNNKPENATVPKCFYKIIVAETTSADGAKAYKALSALFVNYVEYDGNDRQQNTWTKYISTLEKIRDRSGINFLGGLDLEPGFDAAYWGVTMPSVPADCA